MPIFYDRITDQVEELLPEFYREDGPRFISFLKSYFEFLEKGQLIYKDAADIDYIGLEDGTVAGEAFNTDGQRGNMLQESGSYAPSSITTAKINYEHDVDSGGAQQTSFEKDEFIVGSTSGALARVDVIGSSSNLYIEQFSEAQFDIDETITGMTSGMTAKVDSFKASPLHAANNLLSYADVDKTSGDFIEYFRRDFMPFIDRDILANKRLLQKHVKELYLSKGTKESYEFLFRILYGLEAEVVYPGDNVIKPSESEFSEPTVMRLYSAYDLGPYKRGLVKKFDELGNVIAQAYINKAYGMAGTNDANDAYELELILPYVGTFSQGDSVTLSDRDGFRIDATATVRGVMTDIDPDESSIYVGIEEAIAGDPEDIIRLENPTSIYILNEDGSTGIGYENGIPYGGVGYSETSDDGLTFEHSLHSQDYQVRPIGLETGTGVGSLLTEESVYDTDGNLITDYVLLDENTDFYDGMVLHNPELRMIMESNETILLEDATGILLNNDSKIPDLQWIDLQPSIRSMAGGLYGELASSGALYSESDTFNYKSPAGGVATQSINVIGATGSGGVTEIIIDDVGSGYNSGDELVFVNDGTYGDNAEGRVSVTDGIIELENGTVPGVHEFTATDHQTVFTGLDNNGLLLGFDPRKVQVFVGPDADSLVELTRETQFITDKSGQKVTLIGDYATYSGSGTDYTLNANDVVDIHAANRRILLEDALRPNGKPYYIEDEAAGAIQSISFTNYGYNYKLLPKVFMGGYIYYDTISTGTTIAAGSRVGTNYSGGTPGLTLTVARHDTEKKRILVYKLPDDAAGTPSGQVKFPATSTPTFEFTITTGTVTHTVNKGHKVTQTVDGAVSTSAVVKLDSVEAIQLGQVVSGTGISGTPTVTKIGTDDLGFDRTVATGDPNIDLKIELSSSQSISDNVVLTFTLPNSNVLVLDSVADVQIGQTITGTGVTGTPTVNEIDGYTNTIKVSIAQSISHNIELTFTFIRTTVTEGTQAKLWAWGDNIGSVKRLKMQDVGHNFVQGGIGNYKQHAVIKKRSSSGDDAPAVNTIITANLTGATGTVNTFNEGTNILTMNKVKGIFNDGDYCTTSDSKNFIIGKINPCTARGRLGGTALLDGNYTNDTGFPSVDSMRIHDSLQYQDFSYKIKVGKSINDYRSIIKSLLSPAGTIFFGEVSIRQLVDARATIYNKDFDGTQTTRSFIPTLIIGSKIELADIQLENATIGTEDEVFGAGMGRIELENGTGVLTTQRFICTDVIATNHNTHTVKDQSNSQPYVIGTDAIIETDRNFYERVLTAEGRAKGHRVTKDIEIYPAYNQHKIYYSTLSNALAVGTLVRGATSNAQGIVMKHDTTNKFIIVHRDQLDSGQKGSQFSGTEIIQNKPAGNNWVSSTDYFTGTSIELHWTPEDIVTKREPASITADSYITSQAQKTATEGGGGTVDLTLSSLGFHGRGKVLTATDRSETYDSELRQRKVNIISSPLFTQATTQRGRAYSAGVKQIRTLNTQNTRTVGSNTTANNSNGSALRIDSRFNQITLAGNSFGHRPAGQRLFETTNFLSEQIVSESQEPLIMEPANGYIIGEDFPEGPDSILLEDGTKLQWEDGFLEDTRYFVSEESTQIGSYNLLDESGNRFIDETDSKPLLLDEALMIGQKESNESGPSIGDLGNMMFTENYKLMNKIYEEDTYIVDETDGDNILIEDDTYGGDEVFLLVSESADIVLETGEHMLQESPSEGLRINDISTIYPNRFVSNLERELGRKTNFNHSAVIQTG